MAFIGSSLCHIGVLITYFSHYCGLLVMEGHLYIIISYLMSVAVPYRVHADSYPCPGKTLAGKPLARYAGHTPRVRCPCVLAVRDFLSAYSCDLRRSRLPVPSLHRFEWPKVFCVFLFYFLCYPELLQDPSPDEPPCRIPRVVRSYQDLLQSLGAAALY